MVVKKLAIVCVLLVLLMNGEKYLPKSYGNTDFFHDPKRPVFHRSIFFGPVVSSRGAVQCWIEEGSLLQGNICFSAPDCLMGLLGFLSAI